jgi:hypothetical protein
VTSINKWREGGGMINYTKTTPTNNIIVNYLPPHHHDL